MAQASASLADLACWTQWNHIQWDKVESSVKQLQMRIAKATRDKRWNKVKALQRILTRCSKLAKMLAIRRVTQNKGSKTAGVDKELWLTSDSKMNAVSRLKVKGYKALPLKRVYIPKKNKKLRSLGIPTMLTRAMQALYLLALEPVSETLADKHAYGFRPKRSCADAIEQLFTVFSRKRSAQWALEGDIKACFDSISQTWLEKNIPMDKVMLAKWLKAGYIENSTLFPTLAGTPAGGIISPTLLTMTLKGLEDALKAVTKPKDKVHLVTYADDFVISGASEEILEKVVKPLVVKFLLERGLELSPEKTLITHINKGFDFLGFNVRKYGQKLLTKPAKKSVVMFLDKLKQLIKVSVNLDPGELVLKLNLKIKGWSNYYRHGVSKQTFAKVDHVIFRAMLDWTKRRHPERGVRWLVKHYFCTIGGDHWVFHSKYTAKDGSLYRILLYKASATKIRRHIKIKSAANPYDPEYTEYFKERMNRYPYVRVAA